VVLALQSTTLDINTNVEAQLKIMNGLSWHLVEDGYLGIGKHYRKWVLHVIRLQRIYNFLLFHAIILPVLDV